MARSGRRSASLSALIAIIAILLIASLGLAPTRTFVVATDSAVGNESLGMPGSQALIRDVFGKYMAVYVDASGRLSIAYANADPATPGAWETPVKSEAPPVPYARPAALLTSPWTLRILSEGGPMKGALVDTVVRVDRDLFGNIASFSFGPATLVATSAQYVSATLAHDGSILAVWNSVLPGQSSTVWALRWTAAGGWTSVADPRSPMPDAVVVDSSDTEAIHPNIIERPDTLALYVVGNRGPESMMTTLVFNSAAFGGIDWTWRTPNLAWETNASRGFSDATDLAWDPVRFVVVVTYDITHTSRYGVIRLGASGAKEHLDTPSLELTNNEWGVLQVDASSGDYFLFAVNTQLAPPWGQEFGSVVYTRCTDGVWSRALTVLDNGTDDMAISLRRPSMLEIGDGGSLELVYGKGTTAPATLMFVRLSP